MVGNANSGRRCSICHNPDRRAIERLLVQGLPLTWISKIYKVSYDALYRHYVNHLLGMKPSREVITLTRRIAALYDRPVAPVFDLEDDGYDDRY